MSDKPLKPKDLQMSKSDIRVLRKYLEKYYCSQLLLFNIADNGFRKDVNKTTKAKFDRRFRLKIKPVELVLHQVGSEFMSNVKPQFTSIRKTSSLAARANGIVQDRGKIMDNLRVVRSKRGS
ncbi:MAG TPA: hypothetical protein VHA56_03190 [Mucilaginibacter sp.]|nr:hypothetical protein [Mucilaginibacter sp.]